MPLPLAYQNLGKGFICRAARTTRPTEDVIKGDPIGWRCNSDRSATRTAIWDSNIRAILPRQHVRDLIRRGGHDLRYPPGHPQDPGIPATTKAGAMALRQCARPSPRSPIGRRTHTQGARGRPLLPGYRPVRRRAARPAILRWRRPSAAMSRSHAVPLRLVAERLSLR
jgi:hypothetical protein